MDSPRDLSGGTRRWQIGFGHWTRDLHHLRGNSSGLPLFTAVAGVATVVLALLNALLRLPGEAGTEQRWDVAALKRLLQVTTFIKVLTLSFGLQR